MNSDSIANLTNFATPKIHFVSHIASKTYFGNKSIVIFIVEIAYFSHTFAIQIPLQGSGHIA